jgi:hypothetical protein
MVGRVPVLGDDYIYEARSEPIYDWHHVAPEWHRKTASGAKIILDIDDNQYVGVACNQVSTHFYGSNRLGNVQDCGAISLCLMSPHSVLYRDPGRLI